MAYKPDRKRSRFRFDFALLRPGGDDIERGRRERVVGPVVFTWATGSSLIVASGSVSSHLRKRLSQAFRYLDGLVRDAGQASPPSREKPVCPVQEALRPSRGVSPHGIVYSHADQKECQE